MQKLSLTLALAIGLLSAPAAQAVVGAFCTADYQCGLSEWCYKIGIAASGQCLKR